VKIERQPTTSEFSAVQMTLPVLMDGLDTNAASTVFFRDASTSAATTQKKKCELISLSKSGNEII